MPVDSAGSDLRGSYISHQPWGGHVLPALSFFLEVWSRGLPLAFLAAGWHGAGTGHRFLSPSQPPSCALNPAWLPRLTPGPGQGITHGPVLPATAPPLRLPVGLGLVHPAGQPLLQCLLWGRQAGAPGPEWSGARKGQPCGPFLIPLIATSQSLRLLLNTCAQDAPVHLGSRSEATPPSLLPAQTLVGAWRWGSPQWQPAQTWI